MPIMEEATVFRTKTGFDSQMKNTLAAIDRLSVGEEARIYSQNEKWSISTSTLYAPFSIIAFQAVTPLQKYALSQRLDFARS